MYAYYIFFKLFSMNTIFSAWSLSVVINLSKWYLFVCESFSILLFASGCTLEIMRYSLANHTYNLFFPWPGEAGVLLPGRMSLTAWPETLAPWSHELNCMTWKGYLLVNWSSHDSFLLMSSFMKSWHSVVTKLGLPTHKLSHGLFCSWVVLSRVWHPILMKENSFMVLSQPWWMSHVDAIDGKEA